MNLATVRKPILTGYQSTEKNDYSSNDMSIGRFLENRKACVLSNSNTMTASQFVCRACDEFPLEFLERKVSQ